MLVCNVVVLFGCMKLSREWFSVLFIGLLVRVF